MKSLVAQAKQTPSITVDEVEDARDEDAPKPVLVALLLRAAPLEAQNEAAQRSLCQQAAAKEEARLEKAAAAAERAPVVAAAVAAERKRLAAYRKMLGDHDDLSWAFTYR